MKKAGVFVGGCLVGAFVAWLVDAANSNGIILFMLLGSAVMFLRDLDAGKRAEREQLDRRFDHVISHIGANKVSVDRLSDEVDQLRRRL